MVEIANISGDSMSGTIAKLVEVALPFVHIETENEPHKVVKIVLPDGGNQ